MNENIEALDKKLKKMRKDIDVAFIKKLLTSKANQSDVKVEVLRLDDSIKGNIDLFNSLRKDFETLVSSFKKIA